MQYLSSIHQRKGRTGYYITVTTPKSLRNKLGNSIRIKVDNNHREALANRSKVETEIQRKIGKELNQLSLFEEVQEIYKENTLYQLPGTEKEKPKNIYQVDFDKEGIKLLLKRWHYGKNLIAKKLIINGLIKGKL